MKIRKYVIASSLCFTFLGFTFQAAFAATSGWKEDWRSHWWTTSDTSEMHLEAFRETSQLLTNVSTRQVKRGTAFFSSPNIVKPTPFSARADYSAGYNGSLYVSASVAISESK